MSPRVFVLLRSESIVEVTDRQRLFDASALAVAARDSGASAPGQVEHPSDLSDLAGAAGDVPEAVLAAADPALMIGDGFGVEERQSSISAELCDENGEPRCPVPDFTTLFAACGCGRPECGRCHGFHLTPRTAAVLYVNAQALGDAGFDDVAEHGDDPVTAAGEWMLFDQYPPLTYRGNAVWRRQAARAFDDLAEDLQAGQVPEPRCPAEEMALRLTLSSAEAMLLDMSDYVDALVTELPADPDDYDWPAAFESLLQDDDIAALFSAEHDGIEDPDSEQNNAIGMGDYRPRAWFDWFDSADPRDGRRPFRR